MAAFAGRKAILKKGAVVIAGVKVTGLTIGNTPIDISKNSAGAWRLLLQDVGSKTVDFSISGIEEDLAIMKASIVETDLIDVYTLQFPPEADDNTTTGASVTGDFMLTNYSNSNDGKEAATFDASLISSGIITFTDGA